MPPGRVFRRRIATVGFASIRAGARSLLPGGEPVLAGPESSLGRAGSTATPEPIDERSNRRVVSRDSRTKPRHRSDPMMIMIAVLTAGLLLIGAAFTLSVPDASPVAVLLQVGSSGLFLVAGMIAWRRRPHNRIGLLMLLTGLSMWLSGLATAPVPLLAGVGTIAAALPLAMTLHLLLAFPSGRVQGRVAGILVVIGYVTSLVLQMPLYLIGDGPLAVTDSSFARAWVVEAGLLQTIIGVSSLLGAAALVVSRALRSDPVERRQLGPMVWYRVAAPLIIGATAVTVRVSRSPDLMAVAEQVQMLAILGLPLLFLIGLLFGSFGRAGEVDEMVVRIGARTPTASQLTAAVASALGDAEAVVVYARSGEDGFVDAAGQPFTVDGDRSRRLHPVRYDGCIVGGIYHRPGLTADDSLLELLAGIVAMAIDQQRMGAEQRALVTDLRQREDELQRSRRRLLRAEDAERRRIASDLHDGAQQHLVVLGLKARRLSRAVDDHHVRTATAEIADGMTDVLAEFRDLIAGIMPAPLLDRGLVPAIQLLAERMPIPTRVTVHAEPERLAADAESTLYFMVSEALTNVVKHAGAGSVDVEIERSNAAGHGVLSVAIVDDGAGGADPARGRGLSGLADRVATLGGTLEVESVPGQGSTVRAEVPCG